METNSKISKSLLLRTIQNSPSTDVFVELEENKDEECIIDMMNKV